MSEPITSGQAPNQCNVVICNTFDTFQHQIPIEEFVEKFSQGGTFDEVSIYCLEEAFINGKAGEVRRVLDNRANDLANERPTLQFVVSGSFQRVPNGFELQYKEDLYRLDRVFGAKLRKEADDWLVMPY